MRIPDALIAKYFELVSSYGPAQLDDVRRRPRTIRPPIRPHCESASSARDLVPVPRRGCCAWREAHFNRLFVSTSDPRRHAAWSSTRGTVRCGSFKALTGAGLCET
jgi:hypothetical protein